MILLAFLLLKSFTSTYAQAPAAQPEQPEFVKKGQQLMREGKMPDALALFRQTLQTSPLSVQANLGAGIVLDLVGQGEDARKYFAKAIDVADTPERKAAAQRALAMSYAFEGNCKKTVEFEKKVIRYDVSMLAQTYEKLADKDRALEFYRKASTATAHNPPSAYAVPFSKKKLAQLAP